MGGLTIPQWSRKQLWIGGAKVYWTLLYSGYCKPRNVSVPLKLMNLTINSISLILKDANNNIPAHACWVYARVRSKMG